jgi:hypothetical protein
VDHTSGGDMAEAYQYTPLHPDAPSFRILKLNPPRDGKTSKIDCELTLNYLGKHVKNYKAVSYYWGSPDSQQRERNCSISLDGKKFYVSPIVADILRTLRHESRSIMLWIDLICIDQDNLQERNIQVMRMKDIFGHADSVIVSFGPHCSTSSDAKNLEPYFRQDDIVKPDWYSILTPKGAYPTIGMDTMCSAFLIINGLHEYGLYKKLLWQKK